MAVPLSPAGILADPTLTAYWRLLVASGDVPDVNGVNLDLQAQGSGTYPLTYEQPGAEGGLAIGENPPNTPGMGSNSTGGILFGGTAADHFRFENPNVAPGVNFWNTYFSGQNTFTVLCRLKLDPTAVGDFMPIYLFGDSVLDIFGIDPDNKRLVVVSHKAIRQVASEPSVAATVALDGQFTPNNVITSDDFFWVAWSFDGSGDLSTIWVNDEIVLTFADTSSHVVNPTGQMDLGHSLWNTSTQTQFFGGDVDRQLRGLVQDVAIFASVPEFTLPVQGASFKSRMRVPRPAANNNFDRAAPLNTALSDYASWEFAGNNTEDTEPSPGAGAVRSTVWFAYIAPSSGTLAVTCITDANDGVSAVDPIVAVYTGADLASLSEHTSDDDGTVSLAVTGGTTYYIQVGLPAAVPANGEAALHYVLT